MAEEQPPPTGDAQNAQQEQPAEAEQAPPQAQSEKKSEGKPKSSKKSDKSEKPTTGKDKKDKKPPKLTKEQIAENKAKQRQAVEELKQKIADATKKAAKAQLDQEVLENEDKAAKDDIQSLELRQDELIRQYHVAQQEVEDLESVLANTKRDIEEMKEVCAAQLRVYQKKVKHFMAANQNEFSEKYFENEQSIYQDRLEQLVALSDPERAVDLLRSDENDLLLKNDLLLTALRMDQDRQLTALREDFERRVDAIRALHEQRVTSMRQQLEEQRIRETEELEKHKNDQIKQLQEKHARAFENIKRFFSSVTHNNLEVIKTSKVKISQSKTAINTVRKDVDERFAKRKELQEPLNKLIEENERLEKDLKVYEQDKRDLENNKQKIKVLEEDKKNLELAQEVLEQRFEQLEQERDTLYDQFETAIHDVRQKTEFRAFILEQKVQKMHEGLEQKEMQLQRVMQKKGLDATAISAKIEDVMAVKNAKINQLEVELRKVQKAFNMILTSYEEKMNEYGIPKEELGFTAMPEGAEFTCDEPSRME